MSSEARIVALCVCVGVIFFAGEMLCVNLLSVASDEPDPHDVGKSGRLFLVAVIGLAVLGCIALFSL